MALIGKELNRFSYKLPKDLERLVTEEVEEWEKTGKLTAEWKKNSSVWTDSGEEKWLGWLDIPIREIEVAHDLENFAHKIREGGFQFVVLLGMGGSSLCAEVIQKTFGLEGRKKGFPEFRILDSTDPVQIRDLEVILVIETTLFIVSSKSGSTLEPNILYEYFMDRVKRCVGESDAGQHFIAITDPGSSLDTKAQEYKFLKIFHGDPSIGGRFSVLSNFGMVPAALMGVNVKRLLERTQFMVLNCGSTCPPSENPGVILGAILGKLGWMGRDKVTLICSPEIDGFGAWLEQLIAESTGKQGRGLIPVDREQIGFDDYGPDRVFAYIRLDSGTNEQVDSKVFKLEKAGQPVIRIFVASIYDLGQEFFRWESAIAVAGSILGINPFNQPDVEDSKVATRTLTSQYEEKGTLPAEVPIFQNKEIQVFENPQTTAILKSQSRASLTVSDFLRAHLNQIAPGDYFAILAYVPMNHRDDEILQKLRTKILRAKKVATCVEFGPRFLHSTGQVYKGGPNSGVFLQITTNDTWDMPVPGHRYTFGVVKAAEAQGDLSVLVQRHRRVLRIHLRRDPVSGLEYLLKQMEKAVA